MKTRLYYLSNKKRISDFMQPFRRYDKIYTLCHILLPDVKNESCHYFSCDFAQSYLLANRQTTVKQSRYRSRIIPHIE